MKKLALVMAVAFVLSIAFGVVSNAHVNGVREQYEWTVPKIKYAYPSTLLPTATHTKRSLSGHPQFGRAED